MFVLCCKLLSSQHVRLNESCYMTPIAKFCKGLTNVVTTRPGNVLHFHSILLHPTQSMRANQRLPKGLTSKGERESNMFPWASLLPVNNTDNIVPKNVLQKFE